MSVPLLRPAPARSAASARARANAIEYLEVLDHAAPPGAPRQRTLFVRLLRRRLHARRPTTCASTGGERIRHSRHRVGARRPTRCRRGRARPGRRRRRPAAHAGGPHRRRRRLLALHAGTRRRAPAATQPPAGFDPLLARIEFSFKVECPTDFDCAAPRTCPPEPTAAPRHRLPRQGLRGLPPADARPAQPAGAGLARALGRRRRRHAGRAAGLRGRQPVATGRTRSPPRPISPPRASASRCAAMRGWSTTACTRAATRAPGCSFERLAGRLSSLPRGTPAADAQRRTCRRCCGRAARELQRRARRRRRSCSRPRTRPRCTRRCNELRLLHLGRRRLLPAARHHARPRCAGHLAGGCGSATVLVFAGSARARRTVADARGRRPHAPLGRAPHARCTLERRSVGQLFDAADRSTRRSTSREIDWDAADALPFPLCVSAWPSGPGLRDERRAAATSCSPITAAPLPAETLGEVPQAAVPLCAPRSRPADACAHPPPDAGAAALPAGAGRAAADARLRSRRAARSVPAERRRAPVVAGTPLLRARSRATPRRASRRSSGPGRRATTNGRRSATCSAATPPTRDFVVEVERRRPRRCASATTRTASGPNADTAFDGDLPRRQRQRRQRRRATRIAPRRVSAGAARSRRVRNPAAGRRRRRSRGHRGGAARRAAGLPHAGARRHRRPTTPRPPSAAPTCSARPPRSAGPAAGTPCSSPPTAPAARRSMRRSKRALRRHLERFRMAGYDLEVDAPRFVPLDVALHVCVKPDYFRSRGARARCARCCRAGVLPDGRLGVFHPDNFTLRRAGVPEPRRGRRAGGGGRRVGAASTASSAWPARSPTSLDERRDRASAGSRSRSSPTTRTSASAAGSR